MPGKTITTQLAERCRAVRFEDLSPQVVQKVKLLILDQAACEVACAFLPWNQGLFDYVKLMDARGKSTLAGHGLKTNVEYAVLGNSTFGQGFEIDDVNVGGGLTGHPGCVTVPVALAFAQTKPITGKRLIESVFAGYQMMSAIARGIQPSAHYDRGFHAQSTNGVFASAAIAGLLLEEDVPTLANAFSLAASHAGGIMEYTNTGGDVKRLHAGIAAVGGVRSALLAKHGWSGPPTAIEGKRGFCNAFANTSSPEAMVKGFGDDYWIQGVSIKPYACNANIIPAIDALKDILAKTPVKPENIAKIDVFTTGRAIKSVGGIGPEPPDLVGAQFSIHFCLALTAARGKNDFTTMLNVDYRDPALISVAKKVEMIGDKEGDERVEKGELWARVVLTTTDGRKLTSAQNAKGSLQNPVTQVDVEGKCRDITSNVITPPRAEKLIELCRCLDEVKDASELARVMIRP